MPDDLKPELFTLPPGPNGLPDLLILSTSFVHDHGVVRAFIISSDPNSTGYWGERFNSDGPDALKWGVLFAKEKARQYSHKQRAGTPEALVPFALHEFKDWDALSVHLRLGFYPMLNLAASNAHGASVVRLLHEMDPGYHVQVTEQHFKRP